MKAICVSEFADREVLKLEDLPKRRPTESGEVLIRVNAAGLNPYDTYMLSAAHGSRNPALPFTPGFFLRTLEIVAVIIGVGLSFAAAVVMLLWLFLEKALSIDRACGKAPRI
jgi:NADPH:quinone reductase-like Zn-dependent oxidoreductase